VWTSRSSSPSLRRERPNTNWITPVRAGRVLARISRGKSDPGIPATPLCGPTWPPNAGPKIDGAWNAFERAQNGYDERRPPGNRGGLDRGFLWGANAYPLRSFGLHRRAARRVVWVILFGEDRSYTIRFDGARWSRQRGAAPADVTVQTSPPEWVKFLSADPKGRRRWLRQQRAAGARQRLDELMTSFGVLQQTLRSREPGSQRAAMAKN
jgi:hypothetical protein